MTDIVIQGDTAIAKGPFHFQFMKILATLPGRKIWSGQKECRFDFTAHNMRVIQESWHDINIIDKTGELEAIEELAKLATQHEDVKLNTKYVPACKLDGYQQKGVALMKGRKAYALFLEMGLGKTAMAIADMGILYKEFGVKAAFVLTKKGVDEQWATDEIPKHIEKGMRHEVILWRGKDIKWPKWRRDRLYIFIMNTDSIRTDRGHDHAVQFIKAFDGRVVMTVDESHDIKNISAARTKAAIMLGQMCEYRRILTGTPIAKNIIDAFSQFYFLDPNILGHKYMTSFRARYCIMGGYEGRQIVGQRRVEEFYAMIAPHCYRLTKAEALTLPPKHYVEVPYVMSPDTQRHYTNLKKAMLTQLENGEIMTVTNAAAQTVRLQQLACGYLVKEDGTHQIVSSERLDVLGNTIDQIEGPVVVWARFQLDIVRICNFLEERYGKGCCVQYYGETKKKERNEAKAAFLGGQARFFVATPSAGGTGLNLQGKCRNVIYYSNDYNALTRWQSEDRTHRRGTKDQVTYFDIVALRSIDKPILNNLKGKKSISDLSLDQIRQMLVA